MFKKTSVVHLFFIVGTLDECILWYLLRHRMRFYKFEWSLIVVSVKYNPKKQKIFQINSPCIGLSVTNQHNWPVNKGDSGSNIKLCINIKFQI